jgi:hypothetical protein
LNNDSVMLNNGTFIQDKLHNKIININNISFEIYKKVSVTVSITVYQLP